MEADFKSVAFLFQCYWPRKFKEKFPLHFEHHLFYLIEVSIKFIYFELLYYLYVDCKTNRFVIHDAEMVFRNLDFELSFSFNIFKLKFIKYFPFKFVKHFLKVY